MAYTFGGYGGEMRLSKLLPVVTRVILLVALAALHAVLPRAVTAALHNPAITAGVTRGLECLLWLVGASLLVHLVNALLWNRIISYALGAPAPGLLQDTSTTVIYGGAAMAIVTLEFGGSFTAFWTASGALGLVIGLALRSIILDLFTGVAFSVELSFRMGDWLELMDRETAVPYYGRVVGMSWRTTRLELEDRRVVIVPNSRMGQLIAVNSSLQGGVVRAEVMIPLDVSVPTSRAFRVLEGAVASLAHSGAILMDPPPRVLVGAVTAQGIDYRVRYWKDIRTASPSSTRSAVLAGVLEHLAAAEITPAMPQQEVHLIRGVVQNRVPESRADRRLTFLSRVDLFARALNAEELETLAKAMVAHTLPPGELLLREGDKGDSLFILCEGALAVIRQTETEVVQLAVIQPGQVVGEMSLLTGAPRSATVKAIAESLTYEVKADALAALLAERPEIAEALSEVATHRNNTAAAQANAQGQSPAAAQASLLQKIQRFFAGPDGNIRATF